MAVRSTGQQQAGHFTNDRADYHIAPAVLTCFDTGHPNKGCCKMCNYTGGLPLPFMDGRRRSKGS